MHSFSCVQLFGCISDVDPGAIASLGISWSAPGKPWMDKSYNVSTSLTASGSSDWQKLTAVVAAPDVPKCAIRIMLSGDKSTKGFFYWDQGLIEEAIQE